MDKQIKYETLEKPWKIEIGDFDYSELGWNTLKKI